MKKPNKDNVKQSTTSYLVNKKPGRPLSQVVPSTNSKTLRENLQIGQVDLSLNHRDYTPFTEPFEIPAEWNEEDVLQHFNETESTHIYEDASHELICSNLPESLMNSQFWDFKWLRVEELIRNYYIEKEIKNDYPKKNCIKLRNEIIESFEKYRDNNTSLNEENREGDADNYFNNEDEDTRRRRLFKNYFKLLEQNFDYKIVNYYEREETDEEQTKRKEEALTEKVKMEAIAKAQNSAKKNAPVGKNDKKSNLTINIEEKVKVKQIIPGNISIVEIIKNEKTNYTSFINVPSLYMFVPYFKWVASVLQIIKDLKINDAFSDKPIWYNIYPQKDNLPVYNPQGKYIVKLYFMGKARKIEIDDRIPCTFNGELLTPKTENIMELYPIIFLKALLKLNAYKMAHPQNLNEEVGDCSVIYNLTGYLPQSIDINKGNEKEVIKIFESILSDDSYLNKERYLICFNKSEPRDNGIDHAYFKDSPSVKSAKRTSADNLIPVRRSSRLSVDATKDENFLAGLQKAIKDVYESDQPEIIENIEIKLENVLHNKRNSSTSSKALLKSFGSILAKKTTASEGFKKKESKKISSSRIIHAMEELIKNENNTFNDFAYSICEIFDNNNFNMSRLQAIDFSDLKQIIKDAQVNYKTLSMEEKKSYLMGLVDLKNKNKEEKVKRIENLKKEGKKFNLLKIICNIHGAPVVNFYIPYSEEEILMVKKCILNNWSFPPPSFYDRQYPGCPETFNLHEQDDQPIFEKSSSEISEDILAKKKSKVKGNSTCPWNKDSYLALINKNLSQYLTSKEPLNRKNAGTWIYFAELRKIFNQFIVLHNPQTVYKKGRALCDNNWYTWQNDIYEPIEDFLVFFLGNTHSTQVSQDEMNKKSNIMIVFQPNGEKKIPVENKINYYINLEIIDSQCTVLKDKIILNSFYRTFNFSELNSQKDYFIMVKGGVFPVGYHLMILSEEHTIDHMSFNNFLKKYKSFSTQNFKFDHPSIEKNKFYLLSRFSVKCSSFTDFTNMKIAFNYHDKFAKKYIDLYCYKNKNGEKNKIQFDELIQLENSTDDTLNTYYFTISIRPPFNLAENSFEIEFIYNDKEAKIELIEHVEPYEITDKITLDKQGAIFKEFIYSPDLVYTSIDLRLRRSEKSQNTETIQPVVTTSTGKDKKGQGHVVAQPVTHQKNEEDLNDKIRLYVELHKITSHDLSSMELLYRWECYNGMSILNVLLEGQSYSDSKPADKRLSKVEVQTTGGALPYLLICYVDYDEAPNFIKELCIGRADKNSPFHNSPIKTQSNYDYNWVLRMFSSDTLGFVKDTTKEDKEKSLIESWETSETGRAEKAKKSRLRYLIQTKKNKGEHITPEEEKILNEERERKTTNSVVVNEEIKAKAGSKVPPKDNKKPDPKKEDKKKEITKPIEQHVPNPTHAKVLPKPEGHTSEYVKSFLYYTYQERTIVFNNELSQNEKLIVDDSVREEKNQEIIKITQEFENKKHLEDTEMMENMDHGENLKILLKTTSTFRKDIKDDRDALLKVRENIKSDIHSKMEFERTVLEFIHNGNADLNHGVALYKEAQSLFDAEKGKKHSMSNLIKKLFSTICLRKDEFYKLEVKKLTVKEKATAVKYLEDIESHSWNVSEEVLLKLKDLAK